MARKDAARTRKESATEAAIKRKNIRKEIAALRRIAKYVERPSTFRSTCKTCGLAFVARRNGGLFKLLCEDCRSDSLAASRAASRMRRRARKHGAQSENIDWRKVFKAFGGECAQCQILTPRILRGSIADNAPELDHIVALANGGPHTYENIQLLCRRCNQEKSDK